MLVVWASKSIVLRQSSHGCRQFFMTLVVGSLVLMAGAITYQWQGGSSLNQNLEKSLTNEQCINKSTDCLPVVCSAYVSLFSICWALDSPLAIVRSEKRQEASAGLAQHQQSAEGALCPPSLTQTGSGCGPSPEPRLDAATAPSPP